MKIGTIFEQPSTDQFVVMLDSEYDNEQLRFSYVELAPNGAEPQEEDERIIARITNLRKQNPLLSTDQAGLSASMTIGGLGFEYSKRFTYGWAECTIIGRLTATGYLDMNLRVPPPNAEIHTLSKKSLEQLFFDPSPYCIPVGAIQTFGQADEVPVTLDADKMVTKHFCIFGMTGSGKTTTAAKVLEELMARGHRMVIFDSHDDYINLENYSNLFRDRDTQGKTKNLAAPITHQAAVREAMRTMNPVPSGERSLEECVYERLIRAASVIYDNKPARQFLISTVEQEAGGEINTRLVNTLSQIPFWQNQISQNQVRRVRRFPELRFYGGGFVDFSINLLEAFLGEAFPDAQRRWLRDEISTNGIGIDYLDNLLDALRQRPPNQLTTDALRQKLSGLKAIYQDAISTGARAIDLEDFFKLVCMREGDGTGPQTVYRLSMIDLSSNMRKAVVYAVVNYFFRSFKFGNARASRRDGQAPNAYPLLFVLEEARSLIPKSSGIDDSDTAGRLARRAMREIAYEG